MPFPTIDFSHIVSDEQLEMLERVCTEITAESWFSKNEGRQQEFVAKVVFYFGRGLVDEKPLRALALAMARRDFSEITPKLQVIK